MLEVTEHFSEIRRPVLQPVAIGYRNAEHLRGHNGGQWRSEICNQIHAAFRLHLIEKFNDDSPDLSPQIFHARGRECIRRQATQSRVVRGIHEQHLLHHHLRYRSQLRQTKRGKLFGCRGAVSGKVMQDRDYVCVTSYNPGMKIRVPVNRRFCPQPLIKRIWISEHFGIQQLIET